MLPQLRALLRPFVVGAIFASAFVSIAVAATQCLGTTREGKQCKNKVASGPYCHYHTPTPTVPRCAAKTKDGSACRNNAKAGSTLCAVHSK